MEARMAKLIMWNLMSLDGFFEGPEHDISWHNDVWGDELEALSIEQLRAAGALVFGRVTYELMHGYWPRETGPVADFMNGLPKHVFSWRLTASPWHNTVMHDGADLAGTIARLKREADKDLFLFGSAGLASSLAPHDLIDEYRIGIAPVLLGAGTRLFRHEARTPLRLLEARPLSSGVVIARYAAR
jgi:dihydrofolate reductase